MFSTSYVKKFQFRLHMLSYFENQVCLWYFRLYVIVYSTGLVIFQFPISTSAFFPASCSIWLSDLVGFSFLDPPMSNNATHPSPIVSNWASFIITSLIFNDPSRGTWFSCTKRSDWETSSLSFLLGQGLTTYSSTSAWDYGYLLS